MKSGETPSDHSWSDGLAWSINICQPGFHPLSDTPGQIELPGQPTSASLHFSLYLTTPGQIENIGALSTCQITTGLTLLTGGLVD